MTLTRSQNMARIKSKDTKPELLLRRALWRQGLRYRLQYRIENIRPDIVFVKARVALFIDGCQWHGCPEHYVRPRTNQVFWDQRLRVNAERDTKQTVLLRATGWIPYRIWEHDIWANLPMAVDRVRLLVKERVEILAGFDIWAPAARTYAANFPKARVFQNDVRGLSPKDLRREIGNVDIILASPECTNHSVAKGRKERDEESRMTAFEVIRFSKEFRPRWIVMENVVQMKSWSEHGRLLDDLWDLGYFVRQISLNAQDFGVPQSRNRLFLLCALSEKVNFNTPHLGHLATKNRVSRITPFSAGQSKIRSTW